MSNTPRINIIILAAGTGSRFGGKLPQQFCLMAGRPLLMHTIDGIYHHPTYSKSEILWLARNAGLTVEKTLCDLIDDPKVVAKLRERIAAVPENLKKYESDPAHAFLAAEAAWLSEEYEANGVTSAEQLVVFFRKQ